MRTEKLDDGQYEVRAVLANVKRFSTDATSFQLQKCVDQGGHKVLPVARTLLVHLASVLGVDTPRVSANIRHEHPGCEHMYRAPTTM